MRFDLIERFLSYTLQPITHVVKALWHHPVDTVVDTAIGVGEFVQENPLTCIAIVGLGAYAHHRGYLQLHRWGIGIDVDIDTRLGGAHVHNHVWCGKRRR